ncbi:aminotransferase class V-fold PLP-dependent enzyme [Vibrio viridaestus]|uniref:Probable cysteine desulfurase n=1 Tax=Vibrio viridaestus TaxID=2487322 RepID=A0A3N9TKD0_9VIBR|nr:SufS family cysteine desulfurase [Vibrio viridaestus]RQW64434.1 SufS family cysteine desulfurase [Vibrio viridaestus]
MLGNRSLREEFPFIKENENSLVYLDSAATTQKPKVVIDALTNYYKYGNANVHRGTHSVTAKATLSFEHARKTVAEFINARSCDEIIWTKGATESLNLIAQSWGQTNLCPSDEILVCENEHHANIVPWQLIANRTGAKVVKVPITAEGEFDNAQFIKLLSNKTKLVAVAHITNVTGYRQPIEFVIKHAHDIGAKVVIDGAQGIVHEQVDIQELDADFYVFSGHKLYGPTGIGVLYGKKELLDEMPPWQGGGKMVDKVTFEGTTYSNSPAKFEAGTPNIAGVIALSAALEWYSDLSSVIKYDNLIELQNYTYQALLKRPLISIIGYQQNTNIISFIVKGIHHQDIATLLDQQGVAVRSGHHCAHPLMDALGISGTIRISLGVYNNKEDIDKLLEALDKAIELLE